MTMADIMKIKTELAERDPFRTMRDWLRWDPFQEMAPLAAVDRAAFAPAFDVTEDAEAYVFEADLPGVKTEDLHVTSSGNRIQITGKRESVDEQRKANVYTYERKFGSFTRAFTLPDTADVALAKSRLEDGVLTIWVPKKPMAQARKIEITSPAKPKS
jgi:HSP20 family protein